MAAVGQQSRASRGSSGWWAALEHVDQPGCTHPVRVCEPVGGTRLAAWPTVAFTAECECVGTVPHWEAGAVAAGVSV